MELKELLLGEVEDIMSAFSEKRTVDKEIQANALAEYKVKEHAIFDDSISGRPDKIITKDTGAKNAQGEPITTTANVPVARIGLPLPKLIVERRIGFMLSDPVKTEAIFSSENNTKEQGVVDLINSIQDANKMDYRNKDLTRRMMSEMECAEYWYFVPTGEIKPKLTLKCAVWSPNKGDTLYPYFDATGDMVAFARGYKIKEGSNDIEHFDVYTKDVEYKYVNRSGWILDDTLIDIEGKAVANPILNSVGKIMVIYYSQEQPEWADESTMIARLEEVLSNHADMNDYFGSPILAVFGEIMGFAQKGEQGKVLQLAQEAKANYLALSSPPESIKMEIENLEKYIYAMSQTPNITFDQMKGIGNLSGVALELMFLDAHMAVKNKEEIFGMGLQRRLNLLKAAIGLVIDTSLKDAAQKVRIKPIITPYMPQNETEMINNLSICVTSGIMAKETAVENNPYVADPKAEMLRLEGENMGDSMEPTI